MENNTLNAQDITDNQLLEIIQRHLPPVKQERINYLLEKNEIDELTEEEQSKFRTYADRIESEGAERARALVKLAQLRNVEPAILLEELFPESNNTYPILENL